LDRHTAGCRRALIESLNTAGVSDDASRSRPDLSIRLGQSIHPPWLAGLCAYLLPVLLAVLILLWPDGESKERSRFSVWAGLTG